jgi:hypothetical protein
MESFNGCHRVALLDSQDMDYSVKLQKDKTVIAKRQFATTGAYCNETLSP